MDPSELLRIVDTIHRDKNIAKEIVFEASKRAGLRRQKALRRRRRHPDHHRSPGRIDFRHAQRRPLAAEEMAERIGAQTAKQVMIQKIREAERDALYAEYEELKGQLVTGVIQRYEGLPHRRPGQCRGHPSRGEQIPARATTPTSACARPSTRSARRAAGSRSSSAARNRNWCNASSSRKSRNRRKRHRDPLHRPRTRLSHQGRRQQHDQRVDSVGPASASRQPHQEHRR